jgi:serine/threonine-protein kinase
VYRADDLKLGQPVALKFLPAALAADPARLSRFLNEVRLARQVTHPNVCRVHDIGEADGLHFISMEYVDGEDLASLLRRIGRLPKEKAGEIARQVCAGLAAAHERGVLHRDLKPANVMIDGRGRARLSDFGLAVSPGQQAGGEIAGTPAYMAPEQFEGRGASERSDLYALGLVLYELYTGRRAFDAASVSEIARLHREVEPPDPATVVRDIDPAAEHAILRCLAKDPAKRPASAVAVAAELSGGDPLAAVIAAGETPAPELVAAAGAAGTLKPAVALGVLASVLLGLVSAMAVSERLTLLRQAPLEMPPDVLRYRAREMLRGLNVPAGDHAASGFGYDEPLVDWASRQRPFPSGAPVIRFWYRPSLGPIPQPLFGRIDADDPPLTAPGQTVMWLDTTARLTELKSLAAASDQARSLEWSAVLAAAGFDAREARPAEPTLIPPAFADARAAWTATHPALGLPVRVEAAAHRGRLVFFRILGPWAPEREETALFAAARLGDRAFTVLYFVTLAGGIALASRNLRLGRGDRRGAQRLAAFAFLARLSAWLLQNSPAALLESQLLVIAVVGRCLYSAGFTWLLYMAIEPAVRRRWPDALIAWQRLVGGRWSDPRVGRDVLVGVACAVAMGHAWALGRLLPSLWGESTVPVMAELGMLAGVRPAVAYILLTALSSVSGCLFMTVLVVLARAVLRHAALAAGAVLLVMITILMVGQGGRAATEALGALLAMGLLFWLMARFGLLAVACATFVLGGGTLAIPATLAFGEWYGQAALVWMLAMAGMALLGAWTSMGGRPALRAFD